MSESNPIDRDTVCSWDPESPTPPPNDKPSPDIVTWDGDNDPTNPQNYSVFRKYVITTNLGMMTFCVTFASSVFSAADASTAKQFGVSDEVMILGTSLFVLGYALGPIVFGPLSEVFGRKWPLFIGFAAFAIFQIPVAVAQNLQTIMLCRFLGGVFGSSPLAIVGGNLADMFGPVDRGVAIAIFASGTFIGPVAGPIVGGFVNMSYLGWRWTAWITLIMAAFFGLLGLFLVPETFGPVILTSKARRLRFETKNWAIHAAAEEQQVELSNIVQRYLLRPFRMLLQEPILTLITLYMGFIYGFLYLCFEAYPIAFQEVRRWNQGVGQLPFLAITVGVLIGVAIIIYFTKTRYQRLMLEMGSVSPEERLPPMMLGGLFLPVGMFWFGWTYYASISWVPQVLSGAAIGGGILLIFMQGLNYIIDVYTINANSAIAANTIFRSCLGAGFPLFATAMFKNLGVDWAMTLLGCLTAIMFPFPILFYRYGAAIRKRSKFSQSAL